MIQNGQSWGLLQQAKVSGPWSFPPPKWPSPEATSYSCQGCRELGCSFPVGPTPPLEESPATRTCGMNPLTAGFLGKNRLEVSAPRACFCTEGHCGTLRALSPSALCRCPHSGPTEYPTRTAEDLQRVSLHDQGFPRAVPRPLVRTTGLLRRHRVQEPSQCVPSEPHGPPYDVTGVFRTVDSSLQRGNPSS